MRETGIFEEMKPVRLDSPEIALEKACQDERSNWLASRYGLPTIGSKLVNQYGIEWVVQNHATVPTADTLHRWRAGEIRPECDLYPVVAPQNFSKRLMDFFHAIDRCTTKTFAILDTMPGRRKDGHVPGGNSIDTVSHPVSNLLFLDAARVHETVIAHELGHAWVQYVDVCEDLRTMEDASNPQVLRMVNLIQSFVLDLKVNELIRKKGFDMAVIESDQLASLGQLAAALKTGYQPENLREQVFMSLLVADGLLTSETGSKWDLAKYDSSIETVRELLVPVFSLAERLADSVRRHGYDSKSSIMACIDDCLIAGFDHCGEKFDLDRELVVVNSEEPNIDKFPNWIPAVPPKLKCIVGRHMANHDIPWEWAHSTEPTLTERTRVTFWSPEGVRSEVLLPHRIGPPSPYFGMSDILAENLELMRQNAARSARKPEVPFTTFSSARQVMDDIEANLNPKPAPIPTLQPRPHPNWPKQPGRPYIAGLGRFLTAVRLAELVSGEPPYGYAFSSPVNYTDPTGLSPTIGQSLCTLFGNGFPVYIGVPNVPRPGKPTMGTVMNTLTSFPCTPSDQSTCQQQCTSACNSQGYFAGAIAATKTTDQGCSCTCTCLTKGCSPAQVAFCKSLSKLINRPYQGCVYKSSKTTDASNCVFPKAP